MVSPGLRSGSAAQLNEAEKRALHPAINNPNASKAIPRWFGPAEPIVAPRLFLDPERCEITLSVATFSQPDPCRIRIYTQTYRKIFMHSNLYATTMFVVRAIWSSELQQKRY